MNYTKNVKFAVRKDMLHLRYRRTCYICVTERQVTFGLQKDMLHLCYGKTSYIWVTEGHVTFGLQKDMLNLDNRRTCYIWVTEGHVIYDSYYTKLPAWPSMHIFIRHVCHTSHMGGGTEEVCR